MTNDEYAKKYGAQLKAAAYEWRKKEKEKTWEKKAAEERKKKEAEERRKKEAEAAAAARKQKEAESSKRTWFQKGAFEDGYQFGDVTRTVIGTGMDVAEELEEGILEMGEKAIDAGAYLVGGIGGFFGAEDFQNRTADFIKKDLYNSEEIIKRGNEYNPFSLALKAMGTDTESASLLGDRSESLVNSAGQLAAQYGLTMVGVPWFVTSGVTNFGGEVESALNQGASYGEAGMSAAISTGAEILTEKLFGGDLFTKSGGFDAAVDALTKNISHKFVQKATKFGLNALGEGAEEWLSTRIGQFGQWLSYQRKRDEKGLFQMLYSEEAIDEAIESFFGGTILGFGQGGVKTGSQRNSSTQDSQTDTQSKETATDKTAEVQAKSGTEGSQTAMDAFEEVMRLGTNAPVGSLGAALDGLQATGTITDSQAVSILNDPKAVEMLRQEVGLVQTNSILGQKEAVKSAVVRLAQKQAKLHENPNVSKEYAKSGRVHFWGDQSRMTEQQNASLSAVENSEDRVEMPVQDLDADNIFSGRDELSTSEYNRLTSKKPIKVSSQEWAMIRSQRKTKYSNLEEHDIPTIDFFSIGDYRIINNGFIYYIRNSGPDDFSVVMRKQIVPDTRRITREVIENENRSNDAATDPGTGQEGSKRGPDRSSSERSGNGRELSENDRGTVNFGESQRDLHARKGDAGSGTINQGKENPNITAIPKPEAKPGTLEWVKEIADLGAGKDTQKNAALKVGTRHSLGDINYPRIMIPFSDANARRIAENKTATALIQRGQVTTIAKDNIPAELSKVNWGNKAKARQTIDGILKNFLGKDVVFNLGENSAIAYLTSKGIDHTLAGGNTVEKATALSAFYKLISNAEYSYSSPKDQHSKTAGREDWDYFVSVAKIEDGEVVPLVFAVRTIDQDVRSQIYSIATEKNLAIPRGDGTQDKPANAHPSYGDSPSSIGIVNQNNQNVKKQFPLSKENQTESVGAAPEGFTGKQGYYDQLTDENSQPDRPGDVRPMEVLKKDRYGRRVTEFSANAYGAEITSDQMADQIQELIDEGALGFDTRSNPESMQKAADDIREKGYTKVRRDITANVANGRLQDGDIEKAMLLYAAYANRKGQAAQDNAAELMVDLATMANMSGRNLQLFRMLRKLTPEGQRMSIQKTIDRYVEQLNKKRSDKNQAQVEIPQELMDKYEEAARKDLTEQTAESENAKAQVEQEIYKAAASQIKASFVEKLNAWRYMAMLGNVKTQTRNVAGNLTFRPLVNVKRTVGAAIESVTLEKSQRTKSVLGVGAEAKALRQWAREDAKGMDAKKLLSYTARTGDSAKSQIEDARAIYDNKALEATREFIQKVPEAADMAFKRWEYEVSLASFLKARGYTTADITGGKVSEDILNEAREYAALEAMKATFNDRNTVSDALVNLRYKGDSKALKALNILAEGVMPFRRTPANIAVRAVEYSPVNIARGALNLATKVRNGNMSAATAIDQISSGLTGTGAMVLGYALASGIFGFKLKGHLDDEDEKNAGHQAYALEIGGKSYSINWLAPTNIPLFIGANIYQNSQEDAQDVSWFANFANASVNALEPMLELSCMSSLQDWIEDMKYAQSGTEIYTAISSAATNYMSQYIPTLFGQVERAVEGEKKQVYADGDTPLERSIQKTIGYATQKLPGDAFQTQKYDQWGNPVEKDNWFDALINPSSVKEISTDPLDAEVSRLNGAQGKYNVTANKPSQTVSYTDADGVKHEKERLTGEQWEKLQAVYGQTSYKVMSGMIQSEDYTALPDELKAKAFDLAYEYATELGREQALKGQYTRNLPKWMEGLDGAGQDVADAILRYVWTGTTSKYTELSMQDAANVVEVLETLLAESGYTNVRGVQKVEAIVAADEFLTEKEQTEVLKDTLDDKAWDKYQQILKLGLDNDDYAASYRLYLDTTGSGKKERTIKAFQKELGVSYNTARALYEIYNPSKKAAS